jgi:hypothetical protein
MLYLSLSELLDSPISTSLKGLSPSGLKLLFSFHSGWTESASLCMHTNYFAFSFFGLIYFPTQMGLTRFGFNPAGPYAGFLFRPIFSLKQFFT